MLFKKLYIPINLPLTQDKEFELNNSDLEIVRDIRQDIHRHRYRKK